MQRHHKYDIMCDVIVQKKMLCFKLVYNKKNDSNFWHEYNICFIE